MNKSALICFMFVVSLMVKCHMKSMTPEQELVHRILPKHGNRFVFEVIPQVEGKDMFELYSQNGTIIIRGSSPTVRIRGLNWQIIMYQGELAIGIPGIKKRIGYNQVLFISHGTIPERLYKEERNKNKPVTSISIEYKKTGKSKILLHTEQAVECFQYLIRHCPNAAAVDMDSKEFLPKKSSQKERAIKTLRRRKIINGYAAIAIGASCILLACFGVNEYKDTIQYTHTEALRIIALIAGAVWLAFGTKILRG